MIVPLTLGIHFSDTNNLAVSTMIFAPTGQCRPASLSNLAMGEWTFMPNVAHTYLWEKRGLEFDNLVGFDIYTENNTTRYTSGAMFNWDGMVIQYLSKRVGFGAIGSNLTQITNDTGPVADVLHGFEGRSWGVGPMALWVAKVEKPGWLFISLGQRIQGDDLLKGNISVRPHPESIDAGPGRESTKGVARRSQSLWASRPKVRSAEWCVTSHSYEVLSRINRPIRGPTI